MERYNSFRIIHKALRAMLYDTALVLQQTNFADDQQANEAMQKIETTIYHFEEHAHHEDTGILPAIELYEPSLVAAFEQEHEKDHALGNQLKHLREMFKDADLNEGKQMIGSAISKSFVEFMIFNLEHMSREEVLINQALWKHYTDDQLILLNQMLVSNIPAEEKALMAKWILRGVNDIEAAAWLKGVRESVPAFVFAYLLNTAENEMTASRFHCLLEATMETELTGNEN